MAGQCEDGCSALPFLMSEHIKSLIKRLRGAGREEDASAVERQFMPSPREEVVAEGELDDPLGEHLYQAAPRLVHQYKNRCLLLSTNRCLSYCRYCFRRVFASRPGTGFISGPELEQICAYLASHTEIEEILVSGGDVLSASETQVETLLGALRAVRPGLLLRLCTRANIVDPQRFTPSLISLLRAMRPLWVITHVNHPAELCAETLKSFELLADAGIPVQSQSVLLRGVNDRLQTLVSLCNILVKTGIKPGYLFQADLAPGTAHFRVPVEDGIRLYQELRCELSGLSLPVYAVDLPGGGGKFPVEFFNPGLLQTTVIKTDNSYNVVRGGNTWSYPLV